MTISVLQIGVLFEWVGTGTGPFTAGTEGVGYATPDPAFDGEETGYLAFNPSDLSEREIGKGVWSASGGTLTRATILYNGISKAWFPSATPVNFQSPGNKTIVFVPIPDDFGALAEQDTITESQISDLAAAVSQAEAEAGTAGAIRRWSPLRVNQAIQALAPAGGGGGETNTGANVATDGVGVFDGKVGVQLQFRGIASLTTAGLTVTLDNAQNDIDLALIYPSQAEAEAGTNNDKVMTALRVAQAIAAQGTGGGAPTNAQYLVLAAHGTLTAERVLSPEQSLAGTDDGAGGPYRIRLINDLASPGANKVYGTDGSGVRGWQDAAVGALWPTDPDTFLVNNSNGDPVNVTLSGLDLADGVLSVSGSSSPAPAPWPYEAVSGTAHSPTSLRWYDYTNVGAITVTLDGGEAGTDAEGVLQKGSSSGPITITRASGFTINGSTASVPLHGKAIYKRKGATTDFVVTGDIGEPTVAFGDHDHAGKIFHNAEVRNLYESTQIGSGVNGSISYDYRVGAFLDLTLSGAVTTFAITNVPATTKGATVFVVLRNTSGRSFAWPTGTKWPGGTPPTLSAAATGVDSFALVTRNGGAEWLGYVGGQGFS